MNLGRAAPSSGPQLVVGLAICEILQVPYVCPWQCICDEMAEPTWSSADWWTDGRTDGRTDWQTDRLTDWLTDWESGGSCELCSTVDETNASYSLVFNRWANFHALPYLRHIYRYSSCFSIYFFISFDCLPYSSPWEFLSHVSIPMHKILFYQFWLSISPSIQCQSKWMDISSQLLLTIW